MYVTDKWNCNYKHTDPNELGAKNIVPPYCNSKYWMIIKFFFLRISYATINYIEEKIGSKYGESRSIPFAESFEESGSTTPVFFILSPGVDPLNDVELLGFVFIVY